MQRPNRASSQPPSSLDGKWSHDLFAQNNSSNNNNNTLNNKSNARAPKNPSKLNPDLAKTLSGNRLFAALHGGDSSEQNDLGVSIRGNSAAQKKQQQHQGGGFSIRGSAGPFAVRASNFAMGTTANDIRAEMESVGTVVQCIVLAAAPTVIAEIVFEDKKDAEACVKKYNNKVADGKKLFSLPLCLSHTFLKPNSVCPSAF